jgi:thiosulfate/3-mercaptopyruvate sulfurtransferase
LKESLKKNEQTNIKLVYSSWYLPNTHGPVIDDFLKRRLKGSVYFDIDEISDKKVNLPHMVPSVEQFDRQISNLGISNSDTIVCYDTTGIYFASARVWWTFKHFGHKNVSVLERGFNEEDFKDSPHLIESGPFTPPPKTNYRSQLNKDLKVDLSQILKNIESKDFQLVDVRPADRFNGKVPESRAGLLRGHIPGAINIHYSEVLNRPEKKIVSVDKIKSVCDKAGLDLSKPIAVSCGSGVSACVFALALSSIKNCAIYDGSWAEYGQSSLKLPILPSQSHL